MEYFELFEIPVALHVDPSSLKMKFFELSRKFHPDHFASQDEQKQEEALQTSATLNKAWKTFQNHDLTIRYVLMGKGLLHEEEKYDLPAGFLMEVMELNESMMDDENGANTGILEKLHELEKQIYEPVKKIVEHYQEGVTSKEALLQVKEYYYKKKYLDRIRKQLKS